MFKNVLFIGPHFNLKGGIVTVLKVYKNNIRDFNFFSSTFFSNKIIGTLFFPITIIYFLFYLLIKPSIKIVHIHGSSRGSFFRKRYFFKISKFFNRKVVYHIHGGEYISFYKKSSEKIKLKIENMINTSDAVIVLSSEWKSCFLKYFSQKNIYILNNIVKFQEPIERNIGKKLNLLFLGALTHKKGIFDLLNVIAKNKRYFSNNLTLSIGGNGESQKIKNFIEKHQLQNIVTFYGWVEQKTKTELLLKSNIMILPSYYEGLPITLLEGMSFSMPLISTNVGGIPRILINNKNGKVIHPGNEKEIYEAIRFFIENKNLLNQYGKKSYEIVQDFFPEKVLQDLINIYEKVI